MWIYIYIDKFATYG